MSGTGESAGGDYLYKILVIGMGTTGKTCLIRQYVHKLFQPNMRQTIGVDFALKVLRKGDLSITLQLWDISGQERGGGMTRVYYQQAAGALVCYDSSDPASFAGLQIWKDDLDYKLTLPGGRSVPCVLVATKCDLPEHPPRTDESLDEYVKAHDYVGWIRTSAKENIRVDAAFDMLIDKILEQQTPRVEAPQPAGAIPLQPASASRRGGRCPGRRCAGGR